MTVEQLWTANYKLMDELIHDELVPFIKHYLFRWNLVTFIYLIFNILPIFLMIWIYFKLPVGFNEFGKIFSFIGGGIIVFFLIIPIHEFIHAIAYKIEGAKVVSIHAQWSKLIFLASAHHFVADRRSFFVVAIAPFLIINLAFLLCFSFSDSFWQWFYLSAFLIHTSGCAGDFALLSYFWHYRKLKVYTYDDMNLKKSYFFCQIKQ